MSISKATMADLPELESLINGAFRGESSKKGWTTEADLLGGIRIDAETLQQMLKRDKAVMLKFTNEKDIIEGCVYLEEKKTKMYLGTLTVRPELQAMGIGRKLLEAAEVYAKEHDYNSIQITVISVREELIKWYEKKGYYNTMEMRPFPTEEKFGLPKQPLEFIVMEKDLS